MRNRRDFLRNASLATIAPALASFAEPAPHGTVSGINLGIAGFSFNHYQSDIDKAIEVLKQVDIRHITLKNFQLPYDASAGDADRIMSRFRNAGIQVYGLGVIYMKTAEDVDMAFAYAARAGAGMIVGSPLPELLKRAESRARETRIRLAIHNHGPEDKVYPDIDTIERHIRDLDPLIGICLDIGHTFRCGHNPAKMLRQFSNRVIDMHIKDVTVQKPDGESTTPGRGVLPLREVLEAIKSTRFGGICSLEYERPGDPAMGIAESIGYLRGLLKGIER